MKSLSLLNQVTGVAVVSSVLGCGGPDPVPVVPEAPYIGVSEQGGSTAEVGLPGGPSVDVTVPTEPGAILTETASAAGGLLTCVQAPPTIDVSSAGALKACLMHSDLPVNVTCDGYVGTGICHNPQVHSTGFLPCTGVIGVTCFGGVSANIQHGPMSGGVKKIPAPVYIPAIK